jgi:hypothetical protein
MTDSPVASAAGAAGVPASNTPAVFEAVTPAGGASAPGTSVATLWDTAPHSKLSHWRARYTSCSL